jgi:hypothetical protein
MGMHNMQQAHGTVRADKISTKTAEERLREYKRGQEPDPLKDGVKTPTFQGGSGTGQ